MHISAGKSRDEPVTLSNRVVWAGQEMIQSDRALEQNYSGVFVIRHAGMILTVREERLHAVSSSRTNIQGIFEYLFLGGTKLSYKLYIRGEAVT